MRLKQPADDDTIVQKIEVEFAIPTCISQEHQRALRDLLCDIIDDAKNQDSEGVHWLFGCGVKPTFSQADCRFLGKPVDPNVPESGEPTFDDSILYFESAARRFSSDEERQRVEKRRKKNENLSG